MNALRIATVLGAGVAVCAAQLARAQTEIRLWPDGAPGSEHWSMPESVATSPSGDRVIATSATRP